MNLQEEVILKFKESGQRNSQEVKLPNISGLWWLSLYEDQLVITNRYKAVFPIEVLDSEQLKTLLESL